MNECSRNTHGGLTLKLSEVKLKEEEKISNTFSEKSDCEFPSPGIDKPEIKKKKPEKGINPDYINHANRLLNKMRGKYNGIPANVSKKHILSWADDIRKIVEIDKCSLEKLSKVEDWLYSDKCTMGYNIQSASTLRERREKIWLQAAG